MRWKYYLIHFSFILLIVNVAFVFGADPAWSSSVIVGNYFTAGTVLAFPSLNIDSQGNLHTVWFSNRDGPAIVYRKSPYSRPEQSPEKIVARIAYEPLIYYNQKNLDSVIDSADNIHIVWSTGVLQQDTDLYYIKIDSNGNPLTNVIRLTNSMTLTNHPAIAIQGNNLYVAWSEGTPGDIYITKLDLQGNVVIPETRITNDPINNRYPSISINSGVGTDNKIHLVWDDYIDSLQNDAVYAKLNADLTFAINPQIINNLPGRGIRPSVIIDQANNAHILWSLKIDPNNQDLYYEKIGPAGQTLVDDMLISYWTGLDSFKSLALDNAGNIHILSGGGSDASYLYYRIDNNGRLIIPTRSLGLPSILPQPFTTGYTSWADIVINRQDREYSTLGSVQVVQHDLEMQGGGNPTGLGLVDYTKANTFAVIDRLPLQLERGRDYYIQVSDVSQPNANYMLLFAFQAYPGFLLGDGRILPLNIDQLFYLSVLSFLPFQNAGVLDSDGSAYFYIRFPTTLPAGVSFHAVFVTFSNQGILSFSEPHSILLV